MHKLSFFQSIKHDYSLFAVAVLGVILMGFSMYGFITSEILLGQIGLSIAIVLFVLGILRLIYFKKLFGRQRTAEGIILNAWFFRDRGNISFAYEVDGNIYNKGLALMKTKQTRVLKKGDAVTILFNETKPKQAVILHLYSKAE